MPASPKSMRPDSSVGARRTALRNLLGFSLLFALLLLAALLLFFRKENSRVVVPEAAPEALASAPVAAPLPASPPTPAPTSPEPSPASPESSPADQLANAADAIAEARDAIESHRLDTAEARLRDALSIFPGMAEAHRLLGVVHLQTGNIPAAVRDLETSLSIEPLNADALSNLAFAYFQLRNVPMAVELIETCRRLYPDYLPALSQEGLFFIDSDPPRSIAAFSALLEKSPDDFPARDNLAVAYAHAGNFPAAREQLDIVLSRNPSDFPALFNQAALSSKADADPVAAVEWLRKALPLVPIATFQQYLNDPDFDPIRSTPPFQAFLDSLNPSLPPPASPLP